MRFGILFISLFVSTVAGAADQLVNVPSDSKAKYYVLEKSGKDTQRVILTRRVGPSGTSFSKRLYNCAERTVKYLATGDTLADLAQSKPDPKMGPILEGSIAYYIGLEACR